MRKKSIELVENLAVSVMKQVKIPGLALGIIENGEIAHMGGYGWRNMEKNLPMTENTLFGIGSITKSFTAMSIMQLVEKGMIDLDAPLNKYMDFRIGSKKNPIKVHYALSHSSGLPALNGSLSAITRGLGIINPSFPMGSKKDFLININNAKNELFSNPGLNFFYNNDMFTILGLIVEEVSQMSFKDYVKENILKPLKMDRSLFSQEDFEKAMNKITGYAQKTPESQIEALKPPFDSLLYAPGGLISSVEEMIHYMLALMNNGIYEGKQVITTTSIGKMWSKHIKIPNDTSYLMTEKGHYGYAWMIEEFMGTTLIHHGGNITTSSAMCAMIPEQKMGVIIGVNREPGPAIGAIASGILALLLGGDINKAIPLLEVQKKLQKLIGKYELYNGLMPGEVYLSSNGVLSFKMKSPLPGLPEMDLPLAVENLNELKFYVPVSFPGQKYHVQFYIDENGKVKVTADRYCWHKVS